MDMKSICPLNLIEKQIVKRLLTKRKWSKNSIRIVIYYVREMEIYISNKFRLSRVLRFHGLLCLSTQLLYSINFCEIETNSKYIGKLHGSAPVRKKMPTEASSSLFEEKSWREISIDRYGRK